MSTLFGNKKIKACYFGTKKIKEGRFGTKLICGKPFGFTKWRVQSFRGEILVVITIHYNGRTYAYMVGMKLVG